MKLQLYIIALSSTTLLFSCAGDKEERDNSLVAPAVVNQQNAKPDSSLLRPTAVPAANVSTTPVTNAATANPQTVTVNSQQVQQQMQQQIQQQMQQAQQAAQKTAPGMNPPHGQPNHRCDIAVGAPLNSKPAQPATATQPQVKMGAQPVAQQTAPTAPGMNPPHGQPNHRCDIAVGAPLNSKPVTPAAATTPAIVNPAVAAPAQKDSVRN